VLSFFCKKIGIPGIFGMTHEQLTALSLRRIEIKRGLWHREFRVVWENSHWNVALAIKTCRALEVAVGFLFIRVMVRALSLEVFG